MNSLRKLLHILETGKNEIFVEKNIINRARGSNRKNFLNSRVVMKEQVLPMMPNLKLFRV